MAQSRTLINADGELVPEWEPRKGDTPTEQCVWPSGKLFSKTAQINQIVDQINFLYEVEEAPDSEKKILPFVAGLVTKAEMLEVLTKIKEAREINGKDAYTFNNPDLTKAIKATDFTQWREAVNFSSAYISFTLYRYDGTKMLPEHLVVPTAPCFYMHIRKVTRNITYSEETGAVTSDTTTTELANFVGDTYYTQTLTGYSGTVKGKCVIAYAPTEDLWYVNWSGLLSATTTTTTYPISGKIATKKTITIGGPVWVEVRRNFKGFLPRFYTTPSYPTTFGYTLFGFNSPAASSLAIKKKTIGLLTYGTCTKHEYLETDSTGKITTKIADRNFTDKNFVTYTASTPIVWCFDDNNWDNTTTGHLAQSSINDGRPFRYPTQELFEQAVADPSLLNGTGDADIFTIQRNNKVVVYMYRREGESGSYYSGFYGYIFLPRGAWFECTYNLQNVVYTTQLDYLKLSTSSFYETIYNLFPRTFCRTTYNNITWGTPFNYWGSASLIVRNHVDTDDECFFPVALPSNGRKLCKWYSQKLNKNFDVYSYNKVTSAHYTSSCIRPLNDPDGDCLPLCSGHSYEENTKYTNQSLSSYCLSGGTLTLRVTNNSDTFYESIDVAGDSAGIERIEVLGTGELCIPLFLFSFQAYDAIIPPFSDSGRPYFQTQFPL